MPTSVAVLVPVKAFGDAKQRLTGALDAPDRARFARWLAGRVVGAAGAPVYVACDDDDVRAWAAGCGATVVWCPGLGLNGAVDAGVDRIAADGFDHVTISHSDLARPHSLTTVAATDRVTLVPDGRNDGTNVMSFPVAHPVRADYGGGSFRRHLAQAVRLTARAGVGVEVRRDPLLALDVDTASDLAHPVVQEVLPPWLPTNPANRSIPASR